MNAQIVSRKQVIVAGWCKSCHTDRVYYIGEKVLSGWIFLKLDFHRKVVKLRWHSEVAKIDIPIAWRKEEYVWALRMILHVSNHFGELFNIRWLQIDHLVCKAVMLQVPQVDAQAIRGKEVLAVWAYAQRVDIVVVTILELLALDAFVARAEHLSSREHDLISLYLAWLVLSWHPILKLPKFDDPIVCR